MTTDGPPPAPRRARTVVGVLAWVVVAAVVLGLGWTAYRYRLVGVSTPSMVPVVEPGDRFLVDTRHRGAAVGDVLVLDAPGWTPDGGTTLVVKRVVAVAGQRVVCCDDAGRVGVDGVPLAGPGGAPPVVRADGTRRDGLAPFDVTVPPGRVFVMGDNRAVSVDSRAHADDGTGGTLPVSAVRGSVAVRLWPPARIGGIDSSAPTG